MTSVAPSHVIRRHGPEVLAYFRTLLGENGALAAFDAFAECIWKALPNPQGTARDRTFCLVIARGLGARAVRNPDAFENRVVPPELTSAVREVGAEALDREDEVTELGRQLTDEERKLLVLRISEQMSWTEIADALATDGPLDGPTRRARAATLRERFRRTKEKLRTLAADAGMLPCLDDAR